MFRDSEETVLIDSDKQFVTKAEEYNRRANLLKHLEEMNITTPT